MVGQVALYTAPASHNHSEKLLNRFSIDTLTTTETKSSLFLFSVVAKQTLIRCPVGVLSRSQQTWLHEPTPYLGSISLASSLQNPSEAKTHTFGLAP